MARDRVKSRAIWIVLALAALSGSAVAIGNYKAGITFGRAASWTNTTGGYGPASEGMYNQMGTPMWHPDGGTELPMVPVSTGVTSGTYTNAAITVDNYGRITSATAGAGPGAGGYNSVLSNGAAATARSTINMIGGVSCVDNGGASRTDCTTASVAVTDYTGASDTAILNAAIAATPQHSTLLINRSLNITGSVNISKAMTLIVEAGKTLTVTGNTIGITADNVAIIGRGPSSQIVQGLISNNLFSSTSHNGLQVRNLAFTGVASTTIASSNSAFLLQTMQNVSIRDCTFTNFTHYPIWTKGGSEITVADNTFIGNMAWLAAGGAHLMYSRNIARDPQFPNTTFFIPLQFDSTSGGFGAASDVTVNDNQFINWPSSQCILLHSGNKFSVTGNLLDNCYIGISVNSFQAGDTTQDGVIDGNTVIASTTSGLATSIANIPISLGGAAAAPMSHFVVSNNHMLNGNAYTSNDNWGCLNLAGNISDVLVMGNTFDTCTGNGIAMAGANTRITIVGNHMHNFVASAGGQKVGVGVWSITAQSGYIAGNDIDGAALGIRLDVSSNIVVGSNNMTNVVTARILNPGNGQIVSLEDGFRRDAIGIANGASAVAESYQNLAAAANGAQQASPLVEWVGQGWDSTNSLSKTVKCMWQLQPVQAAGNPTGLYLLMCSSNGAAYSEVARHTTGGSLFLPPSGNFDSNGAGAINFGAGNATSINMGNSGVTTWGVAAATINLGTGTNTITNISKNGAQILLSGQIQAGYPTLQGTIASATTIAPTRTVTHITGTTTIQTITAPTSFAQTNGGGCMIFIFDGIAPWNAAGNIAVAGTPTTALTSVEFCYDNANTKWYPSRTL